MDIRRIADELIELKLNAAKEKARVLENAPSQREKFEWTQQKDIEKQELEKSKFLVNKGLELYNATDSPFEKKLIAERMTTLMAGFQPRIRNFMAGMLQHTPLSPMQKKVEDYRSIFKPVKVTADHEKDPSGWLTQSFAREEDTVRFKRFLGDEQAKPSPFIEAPDGSYYYRNPDTKIVTHIGEDEKAVLSALPELKKANMTPEQAKAQGGWVPIEEFTNMSDGDTKYRIRAMHNIYSNSVEYQEIPVGKGPVKSPWTMPEAGRKALGYLRMKDDTLKNMKDPMAGAVRAFRQRRVEAQDDPKKIEEALNTTIRPMLPGMNVVIIKPNDAVKYEDFKKSFWPDTPYENAKEYLSVFPGVKTYLPSQNANMVQVVWVDRTSTPETYWYGNQYLGRLEEALAWAQKQPGTIEKGAK